MIVMKSRAFALLAVAGSLACAGMANAQTTAPAVTPPTPPSTSGLQQRPAMRDGLKDLAQQFRERRADILAARQALVERLKTATDEEKKALVESFRAAQRERIAAERELRKSIREDMKRLRDQRRNAAAGG
jgi:hypothetical protein